ncbi:conserved Plasmodium protein, unknown function [Babesia microti strain RI]|uniref:PUB domain-containing protein n=1 Tax=Babesia microti (strain RI) TaxID=1133968 RepID=A0A1R4AAJ3_BABMR|nr:conserved Plasmodium protein, unknown function [Babesia microti strain RI]SJK86022.1 conserved Plasmodium protein, unknown function [Babesia microti strain RI]|eukprot:XP_021338220.1 conserved Plasmodium protein, unknown function [Babesia microti strain RI]
MGDDSCDDVSDGQSSGIFEKNPSILTKSEGATSENTESTPKIQYTLTPEEAQLKALELQKKLRNERERCEKRNELERERNRMAMGQAIQQQRELFAEQERKRQIEETCKMKMEWEKEKQIQLDLLKKEYKEKFGTDYIEEEDVAEELSDNKRRQKLASICGRITVKYKDSKDVLCLCIKILKLYLSNIIKFPLEQRYKTIKKSNATFSNKVIGPIPEIAELLVYCGFKETDTEFRVEGQAKIYVMSCAITYLDIILKQD